MLGLASVSSPGPGQGVTGDHLQGLAASDRGEADTGGGRSEGGAQCAVSWRCGCLAACCCPDKLRKYQDGGGLAASAAHTRTRPDTSSSSINAVQYVMQPGTCEQLPPVLQ